MSSKTKPIRFGRLRERVKSGELDAQEVYKWARKQKNVSPDFVRWLYNFDLDEHKARAEENRIRTHCNKRTNKR